jgi:hypothetical protein
MSRYLIVAFYVILTSASFAGNQIDYQNKRLLNNLKKNDIPDFSKLEEIELAAELFMSNNGKYFEVKSSESTVKYVFVGRVNSCRAGGCDEGMSDESLESEYFDYYIFFDASKTVRFVEVFNYQATHGYEVTAKGWLKQFVGFAGNDTLIVNKNIDGISGATISVHAITLDVQEKTRVLKSIN